MYNYTITIIKLIFHITLACQLVYVKTIAMETYLLCEVLKTLMEIIGMVTEVWRQDSMKLIIIVIHTYSAH